MSWNQSIQIRIRSLMGPNRSGDSGSCSGCRKWIEHTTAGCVGKFYVDRIHSSRIISRYLIVKPSRCNTHSSSAVPLVFSVRRWDETVDRDGKYKRLTSTIRSTDLFAQLAKNTNNWPENHVHEEDLSGIASVYNVFNNYLKVCLRKK